MLNNTDGLSNSNLCPESVHVRFDIINMLPSIENKIGINYVIRFLDHRVCIEPPLQ